jgi:hypothetical protein
VTSAAQTASPDIENRRVSIIICSINPGKFKLVTEMYNRLLSSVPHEIIGIHDARGLAEAYNRGIERSTGDVIVFSHDDLEIVTADFATKLLAHLQVYDLVGLAGTSRLCSYSWLSAGHPYVFGQVSLEEPSGGFVLTVFGAPAPVVGDIQAVDGLFIAVNRRVTERVRFDESFDGFHFYDLDFSATVHRSGLRLAVANEIHAVHQSVGRVGPDWSPQAEKFLIKWKPHLFPMSPRPQHIASVAVENRQELHEVTNPPYWKAALVRD